jgi:hypothetical protein
LFYLKAYDSTLDRKHPHAGAPATRTELSELLGLRLLRAFQNLASDWERLRVVEHVEALIHRAEAKVGPVVRLVETNIERDEQNGHTGNTV